MSFPIGSGSVCGCGIDNSTQQWMNIFNFHTIPKFVFVLITLNTHTQHTRWRCGTKGKNENEIPIRSHRPLNTWSNYTNKHARESRRVNNNYLMQRKWPWSVAGYMIWPCLIRLLHRTMPARAKREERNRKKAKLINLAKICYAQQLNSRVYSLNRQSE